MKKRSSSHRGYNESSSVKPRGAFPPDNAKDTHPLHRKPKKEKPAVAEKKMRKKQGSQAKTASTGS